MVTKLKELIMNFDPTYSVDTVIAGIAVGVMLAGLISAVVWRRKSLAKDLLLIEKDKEIAEILAHTKQMADPDPMIKLSNGLAGKVSADIEEEIVDRITESVIGSGRHPGGMAISPSDPEVKLRDHKLSLEQEATSAAGRWVGHGPLTTEDRERLSKIIQQHMNSLLKNHSESEEEQVSELQEAVQKQATQITKLVNNNQGDEVRKVLSRHGYNDSGGETSVLVEDALGMFDHKYTKLVIAEAVKSLRDELVAVGTHSVPINAVGVMEFASHKIRNPHSPNDRDKIKCAFQGIGVYTMNSSGDYYDAIVEGIKQVVSRYKDSQHFGDSNMADDTCRAVRVALTKLPDWDARRQGSSWLRNIQEYGKKVRAGMDSTLETDLEQLLDSNGFSTVGTPINYVTDLVNRFKSGIENIRALPGTDVTLTFEGMVKQLRGFPSVPDGWYWLQKRGEGEDNPRKVRNNKVWYAEASGWDDLCNYVNHGPVERKV